MTGTFQGKVALVTGAGSGLGRASALSFAQRGAKVVVADVDVKSGKETVQMIEKSGGKALFIKTDVSKAAEVEAMVGEIVKTCGRLDYAHNNAGIEELRVPFIEGTEEKWDQIIDIDLKSVWLCLKYELAHMVKHGGGAIVNTSSIAGLIGTPCSAMYTAAKTGIIGLTRAAAVEYAKAGIRVNAVCPAGMKDTGMSRRFEAAYPEDAPKVAESVPIGRVSDSTEVAEAVVWLCSDAASYVTGHIMAVDGGFSAQ